ncbi:hypothetical protein SBA4_5210002 [Candidatus Sulfopaludibacter sp. SbA4]|nr:hypothetical protein SBA4_5210002 [Candidatus Sulfopaludibacter sp. SbA4]
MPRQRVVFAVGLPATWRLGRIPRDRILGPPSRPKYEPLTTPSKRIAHGFVYQSSLTP